MIGLYGCPITGVPWVTYLQFFTYSYVMPPCVKILIDLQSSIYWCAMDAIPPVVSFMIKVNCFLCPKCVSDFGWRICCSGQLSQVCHICVLYMHNIGTPIQHYSAYTIFPTNIFSSRLSICFWIDHVYFTFLCVIGKWWRRPVRLYSKTKPGGGGGGKQKKNRKKKISSVYTSCKQLKFLPF
jgi:hypothetical protein